MSTETRKPPRVERTDRSATAYAWLPDAEVTKTVRAEIETRAGDIGSHPAGVLWPSIGSVSPEDARAFADAILVAADEAEARTYVDKRFVD